MTFNLFFIILLTVLLLGNLWVVIFIYIPRFRQSNSAFNRAGLGISLVAIIACSLYLGKLLHIISGV